MKPKNDVTAYSFRVGYSLFIVLAIYYLISDSDYIECSINMGIALIFDPFDPKVAWNRRPMWQRAWLIVHLFVAAAVLGYGISKNY